MLPDSRRENRIDINDRRPKTNMYYLVLAGRFKTAKYITVFVLVLFLLTNVVLFRDEITVENLRYLFKDMEMGDNVNVISKETIKYDADAQVQLALYKGDLVVAGGSYFYLCDLQGNKRLSENSRFSNPVVVSGDKYLLLYGLSENTYTIYNTFSELHTDTLEFPITGAAVSSKGMYAIVTRTAEYRSVVYLYNANFERIGAVYKDKYVMDVCFNKDSSELLITSLYSENGNYCTEIMNYVPLSENASSSIAVEGSMPLKSGYNKDGGYSVVFDDKIEFYDSEFNLRNTYVYPGNVVPVTVEITNEYTVLVYGKNMVGNSVNVLVFNSNGDCILDAEAEGSTKEVKCNNKYVYLLNDGTVGKLSVSSGDIKYYDIERNALELLVVDESNVLVGYPDHTTRIAVK